LVRRTQNRRYRSEPTGHLHLRLKFELLALQLGEPGHLRRDERCRFPGNRRRHRDVLS
jgi:hypothetical protein